MPRPSENAPGKKQAAAHKPNGEMGTKRSSAKLEGGQRRERNACGRCSAALGRLSTTDDRAWSYKDTPHFLMHAGLGRSDVGVSGQGGGGGGGSVCGVPYVVISVVYLACKSACVCLCFFCVTARPLRLCSQSILLPRKSVLICTVQNLAPLAPALRGIS